jgi:hypothetical protein
MPFAVPTEVDWLAGVKMSVAGVVPRVALCVVALLAASTAARADIITILIGDKDGLGRGVADGGTVPLGIYDARSADELAATDGSQFTDHATTAFGRLATVIDFKGDMPVPDGPIVGATVTFGLGGMESNDNNPLTKAFGEDGLFIDGILVDDAFESLVQGPTDYDHFTVRLTGAALAALADGSVTIRIDPNSYGGTDPLAGGESSIWYDFIELQITTVPEPSSIALLGLGVLAYIVYRRRR